MWYGPPMFTVYGNELQPLKGFGFEIWEYGILKLIDLEGVLSVLVEKPPTTEDEIEIFQGQDERAKRIIASKLTDDVYRTVMHLNTAIEYMRTLSFTYSRRARKKFIFTEDLSSCSRIEYEYNLPQNFMNDLKLEKLGNSDEKLKKIKDFEEILERLKRTKESEEIVISRNIEENIVQREEIVNTEVISKEEANRGKDVIVNTEEVISYKEEANRGKDVDVENISHEEEETMSEVNPESEINLDGDFIEEIECCEPVDLKEEINMKAKVDVKDIVQNDLDLLNWSSFESSGGKELYRVYNKRNAKCKSEIVKSVKEINNSDYVIVISCNENVDLILIWKRPIEIMNYLRGKVKIKH